MIRFIINWMKSRLLFLHFITLVHFWKVDTINKHKTLALNSHSFAFCALMHGNNNVIPWPIWSHLTPHRLGASCSQQTFFPTSNRWSCTAVSSDYETTQHVSSPHICSVVLITLHLESCSSCSVNPAWPKASTRSCTESHIRMWAYEKWQVAGVLLVG